ncbi:glycoside hydrolase family 2 protein [Candidatus Epulonipiscium viviparus]|uniref:glycoside hydrolase family 2 protein n=1 Tax=Candidatus Epulonipiscium viviparus TaxID=420336 RepID=UPI000494FC85|nr:glycoside hydrolase family 2 [Candidatus Epulopiscium viviparus]
MIRAFKTNVCRNYEILSNTFWNYVPNEGEHKGKNYQIYVPSCLEKHPDFLNYRGSGTFYKKFYAGGSIRLVFKGVSHTARVYIDDQFVTFHYNAYTPFEVVIKDLDEGNHILKVEVDNSFNSDSVLHKENDYMTYGGITRGVVIERLQSLYIRNLYFTPVKKGDLWTAKIRVIVENVSDQDILGNIDFMLETILGGFGSESTVFLKNSLTELENEFEFPNVLPWDMESPNLYLLKTWIIVDKEIHDDLIETVGFREITLDGNQILLNGKRIRIKGFNRHEDHPEFGCSLPYASMVHDIEQIKDMGANAIRTSHYPNDELFLDLCDEAGILVWEEAHARGFKEEDMDSPNFMPQSISCINEMVDCHYNHPSIFIWGVLNECISQKEPYASYHKIQLEQLQILDPSRPNTFASNKHYKDICFAYPTVVSNNMYPLWYLPGDVAEVLQKHINYANDTAGKVKPFIVSEIGCGAIYGYRQRSKEKWSEEGQADIIAKQITPMLENAACTGVFIWQYCDCQVSAGWFKERGRLHNNKGIVDEYRRPKLAYDVVKNIFNQYGNYFE